MPNDEFERLLERCRDRLSEISLTVPTLESGSPRRPVYSLAPPEPPPPKPPPEPAASRLDELEEQEFFPPQPVREKSPPPAPLWSAPATMSMTAPDSPALPAPKPAAVEPARPSPTPARKAPAPSQGPEPRVRRLHPAAAASAAAAVAAAGTFGLWLARRSAADLDIDAGDAEAMTVRPEKGDLLVAQGRELIDLSQAGRPLERRPLDAPVDSLCWGGGSLWSTDGRSPSILERADNGRATSFALNHVPGAVYVNDKYLWTVEKDGRTLHQFLLSRSILGALLQPLDSYDMSGIAPETFTIDENGTLWVTDAASRRLYRLRLDNGAYKTVASAPLSPFVGPQGRLRGLAIENGHVWILSRPDNGVRAALRRISLSHLDWTP